MDFAAARHNMVESQVRPNRVIDPRLIEALRVVPRERFVPEGSMSVAYFDGEIPLGNGRALISPTILARLLQAAAVKASDIVLDVGAGSLYSSALLARLAGTVVALESDAALAARGLPVLTELGAENVVSVTGPLAEGDAAHGPYDVIVAQGTLARMPEALTRQLAEGGRIVAVLAHPGMGRATLWQKLGGRVSSQAIFDAKASPLPGFSVTAGFVF